MKQLGFFFFSFFLLHSPIASAQQNHFIYIQTENKQPFYIKFDKKIISSSLSGYLIIPKLTDGQYDFTVGFPQNEWAEQSFICTVSNKDLGFLLKNFGEKGWGFFNLQTLDITMAKTNGSNPNQQGEAKADEFSTMLSTVVNDPSIKQMEPPAEKQQPVQVVEAPKPEIKEVPSNVVMEKIGSVIKKEAVKINDNGQEIVYIDIDGDKQDTIVVFIPASKPLIDSTVNKPLETETSNQQSNEQLAKPETKVDTVITTGEAKELSGKKEPEFLNIEVVPPVLEKDNTANKPESIKQEPQQQRPAMINSDCKNFATDEDFLKLRKKMASAADDDKMIEAAKKVFKSRCFTTEQIKNLGVLLLKDAGRYSFYDAAYPFVSDSHNYSTLAGQLSDPYYINRFNVMIRN